jgi:threonine/homoserine/homoserine lactone efflux protein
MTGLPVFFAAMFLLFITPGPDMLYIIARSIGEGRTAGLASALGIGVGCFFHIFAVAFGLAELLRTVPVAYNAVRYAGAAYLIYLGFRTLFARGTGGDAVAVAPSSLSRVFAQGAITNILNPKVALFFLAFLPQFIVRNGNAFAQTVRLGLIFDFSGTLFNVIVALTASSIGGALRNRIGGAPALRWMTGSVFVGLGLWLAARDV